MSGLVHSKKTQTFAGEVVWDRELSRKVLRFCSEKALRQYLNLHTEPGDKVSINITRQKPKRTLSQNSFLWAYYTHISGETGHTPEEVHEWSKTACLPTRIVNVFGDKVRIKKSTTDLSVSDFIEYVMALQEKTGITMPPLENYHLDEYKAFKPLTPVLHE
jgi:hypothetical protein